MTCMKTALYARAESAKLLKGHIERLREAGYKYFSIEEYVLAEGYAARSSMLEPDEEEEVWRALNIAGGRFFRRECFHNAQSIINHGLLKTPLRYTEGYFWRPGVILPVHHAWVSINRKVVDLTARMDGNGQGLRGRFKNRIFGTLPEGWEYFGVDIPQERVLEFFRSNVKNDTAYYASIIEDLFQGAPLLKGETCTST